jgi:hypothetical protein
MTTLHIPSEDRREWRGIFPSKFQGDFHTCWNIDLENESSLLALAGRGQVVKASDSDAQFLPPAGFIRSNADGTDRFWANLQNRLFRTPGADPFGAWSQDTLASTPSDTTGFTARIQDIALHGDTDHSDTNPQDRLLATLNTGNIAILNPTYAVKAWDTDWWTDTVSGVAQAAMKTTYGGLAVRHVMGRIQKLLIILDGDALHTVDKDDVVNNRSITFPPGYVGTCLYTTHDRAWIGIRNIVGDHGWIIEWDGFSETFNEMHPFDGVPISGWVWNNLPFFINNYGQIMYLVNDGGFIESNVFPIFDEGLTFSLSDTDPNHVHHRGCFVDGDFVKILAGAPVNSLRMKAGLWVFDIRGGNLFHQTSLSGYVTDTDGSPDFGQQYVKQVGAVYNLRSVGGGVKGALMGGEHYSSYSGTTQVAIYRTNNNRSAGDPTNRGHFLSAQIPAVGITDNWKKAWAIFRRFIHGDNRIVIKSRIEDGYTASDTGNGNRIGGPLQCSATWLSATTFSGPIPTGVKVGDEVEVIAGENAGCTFHISALSGTPDGQNSVTVTIDESAPSSDTNGALVRFDNWTKISTFSDTSVDYEDFVIIGSDSDGVQQKTATFVQFKVEMRGKKVELGHLRINSDPSNIN